MRDRHNLNLILLFMNDIFHRSIIPGRTKGKIICIKVTENYTETIWKTARQIDVEMAARSPYRTGKKYKIFSFHILSNWWLFLQLFPNYFVSIFRTGILYSETEFSYAPRILYTNNITIFILVHTFSSIKAIK